MSNLISQFTALVWPLMPYYTISALTLFFVGLLSLSVKWFSKPPKEPVVKPRKTTSLSFGTRVKVVLVTVFGYWIGSGQVFRRSKVRWIMHICIFIGAVGLVIFHAAIQVIITPLFRLTEQDIWFPGAPLWIRIFFHNLFFILLIIGATIAIARRIILSKMRPVRNPYNFIPLIIILSIAMAGLFAGEFSPFQVDPELQSFFLLLHAIMVYTTIAYLPYGKFVHVLATPAIILKRSIDERMRLEWYRKFGGGE